MRIRIVSWNIHKGIGGVDRQYRPQRVVDVLLGVEADILLLQEVSDALPRAKYHEQASMLAESLALKHVVYAPEHRFKRGGYGNAILSRWPLTHIEHVNLTMGNRKKRGAITARTRATTAEASRTVVISNLHLGLAGTERAAQLRRFLATAPFSGTASRTPVVLGGDLNDLWGTLGPRFLIPGGFRRAGALANTFPAWLPLRPLDGIFVRGDVDVIRCMTRQSRLARTASDHLPLVADVELPPSQRDSTAPR